jgi:hypothetical protein
MTTGLANVVTAVSRKRRAAKCILKMQFEAAV